MRHDWKTRRHFLKGCAAATAGCLVPAFFTTPGLFAQQLALTPSLTEGPFYPRTLPLDTDNDLIIINNSLTPAVGQISHIRGRVLTRNGSPVRDATVEIWQCDARAVYHGVGNNGGGQIDNNFQGFGRFTTAANGQYYFRTIKPVPYPGRPSPHIHVKVKRNDHTVLTTQFFINGHSGNQQDGIFRAIQSPLDRQLVLVDFRQMPNSPIMEFDATFDIVLGITPAENG
jgi:protocatechuate 3,4-dioxygenase beta subunit